LVILVTKTHQKILVVGKVTIAKSVACLLFGRGGHPSGKPGKVREFDIGQGKVREIRKSRGKVMEIVVCLWCATAVAMVTK